MSLNALDRAEGYLTAALLAAMTLLTFVQVVLRYVFNSGLVWALEATVYLFGWLVLIGMSHVVRTGTHIAVDVVTNPTFEHGRPRKLFEGRFALGEVKDDTRAYDVAPDGQRFLMLKPETEPSTADLKVVVNWYGELRRLGLTDR